MQHFVQKRNFNLNVQTHCTDQVIIEQELKPLACQGKLRLYPSAVVSGAEIEAERKADSFSKSCTI